MTVITDSRCHDPAACRRVAAIHHRADRTRVKVLYLLRTRRKIPDSITDLARAGGTIVEVLE